MLERDPLWYKDAIIYEVHVRAFNDNSGDGIGDFRGLTEKIDYIQDLGVTAIWLLPFYPSPRKDDGYDIAEYTSIHDDYGNMDSFREFLDAAHARGIRVITELVINHTSDQHAWFQRARRSPPGSPERDFYVWSDTPDKYNNVRIIFQDFEASNWTWDKVAQAYYWHRFYSHQPDLNFDNPAVWDAIFPVVDFWMELGVDGMRLDAIPYLYEREGTTCESLPETHAFLKALRKHIDERFPDRMLLAEANQWPEDSIAYFGNGDECQMAFYFPVMPRLFMSMHMEDRLPIVDIMEQTPAIPETCQWAMFLRNHDELTLEMVTEEERDYMYRAYANDPQARINLGIRRRLAPLLGNNRRRIELMNGLLFSLPGSPVLYYGDEIGMGDNIYLGDRNGVRTPMQWSADRNGGFSKANPQRLYLPTIIDPEYHYEAVNVESQQNNLNSLLWWTKRLIGLRKMYRAFSRGSLEFIRPLNRHVLAFLRRTDEETVLVVANLSRFVQAAELELSEFSGLTPIELFGGTRFPAIGESPYPFMLGPHSFYWFILSKDGTTSLRWLPESRELPTIRVKVPWERLASDSRACGELESALAIHLRGKTGQPLAQLRRVEIEQCFPLQCGGRTLFILILKLQSSGGDDTVGWIAVELVKSVEGTESISDRSPPIAKVEGTVVGWLVDARDTQHFQQEIAQVVRQERMIGGVGDAYLKGVGSRGGWQSVPETDQLPIRSVSHHATTHTSQIGNELIVTQHDILSSDPHPEHDLGRWLSETKRVRYVPRWLGELEYHRDRHDLAILASIHDYVPNEGTAWQYTLDEISSYFDRVLALSDDCGTPEEVLSALPGDPTGMTTASIETVFGSFGELVRQLAERLAQLHLLVATDQNDIPFLPEPFTLPYQRSVYQSARNLTQRVLRDLRSLASDTPEELRTAAAALASRQDELFNRFHRLVNRPISAWRVRVHGDCHLGHFLRAGHEFVVTDFDRSSMVVAEKRIKRSSLRDVATMLHSFNYVVTAALEGRSSRRGQAVGIIRPEDYQRLKRWSEFWRSSVHQIFIDAYRHVTANNKYLALADDDFNLLIDLFLLERTIAEAGRTVKFHPEGSVSALESALRLLPS